MLTELCRSLFMKEMVDDARVVRSTRKIEEYTARKAEEQDNKKREIEEEQDSKRRKIETEEMEK